MSSGTREDPTYMALVPPERNPKDLVRELMLSVLFTAIPIGVAIVMQRPALRQQIIMRSCLFIQKYAQKEADTWTRIALNAATAYHKARM